MKALKFDVVSEEHSLSNVVRMPEHDLMASILASAVAEAAGVAQCIMGSSLTERKRRQEEARRWIFSEAIHCAPEVGVSFQFICEVLDVDATSIRKTTKDNPEAIFELMTVFRDRSMKLRSLQTLK